MSAVQATVSFLATPKLIEVHYLGAWRPGLLLGWRHDADESCHLRVSAAVGGLKQTAWVDLAACRLPQPPPRRLPVPDRGPDENVSPRPGRTLLVPPRPVALSPVRPRPRPRPHRADAARTDTTRVDATRVDGHRSTSPV